MPTALFDDPAVGFDDPDVAFDGLFFSSPPPPTPADPPPAIDLDGIGSRTDLFVYEVLDPSLNVIGELHPVVSIDGSDAAPSIRASVQGSVGRTLTDLILLPDEAADFDARLDRIRVVWVDADGTRYPLGVHRVADATAAQFSGGDRVELTLADESVAHRARIPRSLSWPRDTPGAEIIEQLAGLLAVPLLAADPTTAALGEPLAFPVGSVDWPDVYAKVAEALGMLAPHFTNEGAWRWRHAPDWEQAQPDHRYSTSPDAPSRQRRIVNRSLTRSVTLLDSPNTWVATNTGAGPAAIVGRYTLPASAPNSFEQLGVVLLADPVENVGFASAAAADAAARAAAARSMDDIGSASLDTPLDARHDLYDLIEGDGLRYREVGYSGRLSVGAAIGHSLRRVYLASDPPGPYVGGVL